MSAQQEEKESAPKWAAEKEEEEEEEADILSSILGAFDDLVALHARGQKRRMVVGLLPSPLCTRNPRAD